MADTLATIIDKINGLNTKIVRNPAANVPPARNSLQATIQNDIPGLPALVRAIVQAIVRTESIEIEPNKCAEISSRIIAKHNSTVAEIIKQFSDSIVNFESTDQFKKIKTYSEKLVEDIIKSFIETEETEQTESLSTTQLNKLKKLVNEIIKEVITWVKRSSIEALHQFKLHVTDQLNNKQTESEQNFTEEEIDKLVEKETAIESAKIQFTDLASANSIAPQICSEKLTYGAIKVQTALLKSISRLSLNVNNTLGKLDNILNPVKFMKFVDAISNAGPQIRKALNKAIANNKKNTLGMTNLSEDAIREYLLREIKEQNDLVEKAIANGNFEESRKNLSNFDIFKKASRAKSFNIFKKEISKTTEMTERMAMTYGMVKMIQSVGKVIMTGAYLATKVLNKAMGVAWKAFKFMFNATMLAITGITSFIITSPLKRLMQSRSGMLVAGMWIGAIKVFSKGLLKEGAPLRKLLDEKINKLKDYIFGRFSKYGEKIAEKVRKKLGMAIDAKLTFNSILDASIKMTYTKSREYSNNMQYLYKTLNIVLRVVRFIVNITNKIIKGVTNYVDKMKNFASKYFNKNYLIAKRKNIEHLPVGIGDKTLDYYREYSMSEYIFDFKNGFFPDLWRDISKWWTESWISSLLNTVVGFIEFVFKMLKNIGPIAKFLWDSKSTLAVAGPVISFANGINPLLGLLVAGITLGLAAMSSTVDEGSWTVDERYREIYGDARKLTSEDAFLKMDNYVSSGQAGANSKAISLFSEALFNEQSDIDALTGNIKDVRRSLKAGAKKDKKYGYTPEIGKYLFNLANILEETVLHSKIFKISPEMKKNVEKALAVMTGGRDASKLYNYLVDVKKNTLELDHLYNLLTIAEKINQVRSSYVTNILRQINDRNFNFDRLNGYDGSTPIMKMVKYRGEDMEASAAATINGEALTDIIGYKWYRGKGTFKSQLLNAKYNTGIESLPEPASVQPQQEENQQSNEPTGMPVIPNVELQFSGQTTANTENSAINQPETPPELPPFTEANEKMEAALETVEEITEEISNQENSGKTKITISESNTEEITECAKSFEELNDLIASLRNDSLVPISSLLNELGLAISQ